MKQKFLLALLIGWMSPAIIADCAAAACTDTTKSCSSCTTSNNTWLPRSFSSHSSREIILEKSLLQTESHREEWNGTLSFATEYMQNFGQKCGNCKNLGAMPFWSGTNSMTIGNNDGKADVDAYQFGLGNVTINPETGISGTINLNPKIQHVGSDMMLYFTQKKDARGFFFKLHAPLGAMIIDARLTEPNPVEVDDSIYFNGVSTTSAAYQYVWAKSTLQNTSSVISTSYYPGPDRRYDSMISAFAGGLGHTETSLGGNNAKPIGLLKGRISQCKQVAIKLADLSVSAGYNLFGNDKGLVGVAFKATCPTGNVPTANYALEPIFGRAGAWGVGGEVMAHYKVWSNEDDSKYLDLWLQGEALHLMPGRTPNYRSFDLKQNGAGSKYLLLQYYEGQSDNTRVASHLTQAINVTTLPVISKIAVEGSVAVMANYHHNNWNVSLGGEFWARSKEKLAIDMCSAVDLRRQDLNNYAVVGRQVSAYTVAGRTVSTLSTGFTSISANLCEPLAKINKSQDAVALVGTPTTNNAAPFIATLPTGIADATVAANRIPAALDDALDICGAQAAKAYTGKVFGNLGYTFAEHRYTPTVSLLGGAEFTNKNNNAIQFWSAGIQGALNF